MFKRILARLLGNSTANKITATRLVTTGDVSGRGTSIASSGSRNVVTVNGSTHVVYGNNVVVRGNAIYVDDKLVVGDLAGDVHVKWEGDVANVDCTSLDVSGDVLGDVDATNVRVRGSITARKVDATNIHSQSIVADKIDATNVKYVK